MRRTPLKRKQSLRSAFAARVFAARGESKIVGKFLLRDNKTDDVARRIVSAELNAQFDKLEREIMRHPGTLKRTRLKTRSPRKRKDDAKYTRAKAEHFAEHPGCQFPGGCARSLEKGDAMDLHHKAGRNGPLLYAKQFFATACRPHHDIAKSSPGWSRANGWVVDVPSEEVRRLRQQELLEN